MSSADLGMMPPDLLATSRVAILGLGLMGGSLALALRGHCAALLGFDPDPEVVSLARQREFVEIASTDAREIVPHSDLLILAAPVRAILRLLEDLPNLHPGSAVVLDLGSTKTDILAAMAALPDRFDPLGGHPMCGKESASLQNAEVGLFRGAAFAFTPLARTTTCARALAEQIARCVGAQPLWLEAAPHDRWAAATSHIPFLAATALALATPLEAAPLVGPGFRSTSRLAGSAAHVMADVLLTNRENVLAALRRYQDQLRTLEGILVQADEQALAAILEQASAQWGALTGRPNGGNGA